MKTRSQAVLSLTVALTLSSLSQANSQEFFVGARGGLSVTDYSLPYLSEDWRSGAVAGAFVSVPLADHFSLQPELSVVRKGAKWFRDDWGPTRADLDYVEALVSARASVPLGEAVSLDLLGGPWLGVLSKCEANSPDDSKGCPSTFGEDDYNKTDLGWTIGLGAALQKGPWISQLDLRWSRGISGIIKDRPEDNPSTRSTQFSLGIGYRISGG